MVIPGLLKWIGNKQNLADTIISYMPKTFNNYYEPFLGSGAVMAQLLYADLFCKAPHFKYAYGSDILPFLIEIFDLVKTDPHRIATYYESEISRYMLNPEQAYLQIRDRFNRTHNALDFCLLSRTCYSGIIRFRKMDGYMSTPKGPHRPIAPFKFTERVNTWSELLKKAMFRVEGFDSAMDRAKRGDVVYCDPPYTHCQGILYGAQSFEIDYLWQKIKECKDRGVKVMVSINGTRESMRKDISVEIPRGLFKRVKQVNCGISRIERLRCAGKVMSNEVVHDRLCLTW